MEPTFGKSDLLELSRFLFCVGEPAQRTQDLFDDPRSLPFVERKNLSEHFSTHRHGMIRTHASDENQCIQPQPFHCAVTQCIMNDIAFFPLAFRCGGLHNKEGTNCDIYRLDDDHIRERDELCTYQTVDSGNNGGQYLKDLGNETAVCLGFYGACLGHRAQDWGDLSIYVCRSLNEGVHNLAELVLYDVEAGGYQFFRIDLRTCRQVCLE